MQTGHQDRHRPGRHLSTDGGLQSRKYKSLQPELKSQALCLAAPDSSSEDQTPQGDTSHTDLGAPRHMARTPLPTLPSPIMPRFTAAGQGER